jgi:hypothetical protein
MCVSIERRTKIRVPQQGLRGLDRLPHFRKQRRVCVPERVPRNARLFDPITCGGELDIRSRWHLHILAVGGLANQSVHPTHAPPDALQRGLRLRRRRTVHARAPGDWRKRATVEAASRRVGHGTESSPSAVARCAKGNSPFSSSSLRCYFGSNIIIQNFRQDDVHRPYESDGCGEKGRS